MTTGPAIRREPAAGPAPDDVVSAMGAGEGDDGRWADLAVHEQDVATWKAEGFGPFDAAMAQGDGFTPSIVTHYRNQLQRLARSWERQGLGSAEGLRWHQAGFAATDAVRWRAEGVDIATARARREGYAQGSSRSGLTGHGRKAHR